MLELDDIQHFLLTRPRALAARYGFLSLPAAGSGTAPGWPASSTVSVAAARSSPAVRSIRAGSPSRSPGTACARLASTTHRLATFPEEFRQGMAARAAILGDTGANHPDHWVGGLASPDLHAIVILFARDVAERERCVREHQQYAAQFPGVEALSTLDLEATPPLDYAHDHFGYRDRHVAAGDRGHGHRADARFRRAAQAGRVLPRVSGRERRHRSVAAARDPVAQRQLSRVSADGRARRRVPRFPASERRDAGGAGTDRREADGTVAQRRTARARARRRTTLSWRRTRSATTTSITGRWTRTATRSRSARTFGA